MIFNIGDKVIPSGPYVGTKIEREGVVYEIREGGMNLVTFIEPLFRGGFLNSELKLVKEGPIRTVTKREIVPGVYGRAVVGNVIGDTIGIGMLEPNSMNLVALTSQDLREAANLFNQLAEVLEDE